MGVCVVFCAKGLAMNIRDLRYLVALADTRHFGKAAARCYVSQPTLSMQVKKMEESLGLSLFERTNKAVLVTPSGEKIIAQARLILNEINTLTQLAQQEKNPYAGVFRLGIIPTIGPYLLPELMPALQRACPELAVQLYEDKTDVIMAKLRKGELDGVLLALPVADQGDFTGATLLREPFYVAVPAGHPLTQQSGVVAEDLRTLPWLLLGEGHCFRAQALAVCQHQVQAQAGFQATSLETLRNMVATGAGVTLLPEMMVRRLPEDPGVVILPFQKTEAPSRDIGLLWRTGSPVLPICEQIMRLFPASQQIAPA